MAIPYEARRAVYQAAIATNGIERQTLVAIEEMAELTKELAKCFRPGGTTTEKLVDEIADVLVMMEQMQLIFDLNLQVPDRVDFKIHRLAVRLGVEPEVEEFYHVDLC